MNGLSRRHALYLGLALIVFANAVALGGVAYNRSAEDSRLRLSWRELRAPYAWWSQGEEDSGMSLVLTWRTADSLPGAKDDASWLDAAKLAALGFAREPARNEFHGAMMRTREVFLVLELAGPAWESGLGALREKLAQAKADEAAHADDKERRQRVKWAAEALDAELGENSRLVAIDAGLDDGALRAKYPDRTRYAIVRGRVRAWMSTEHPSGHVEATSAGAIHVPAAMRQVISALAKDPGAASVRAPDVAGRAGPKFQAEIAFGRRYEPWIVSLSAGE